MTSALRINAWGEALMTTVDRYRSASHEWGRSDCCQFAADCIQAMTGYDLRENFARYNSEATARAILIAHGGIEGLATSVLGAPKSVARAQVGDLVGFGMEQGEALAICLGLLSVTMSDRAGALVYLPTLEGVAAWSV
jgi:hypothetical protein